MGGYFPNATACSGLKRIVDSQSLGSASKLTWAQCSGIFMLYVIGTFQAEPDCVFNHI